PGEKIYPVAPAAQAGDVRRGDKVVDRQLAIGGEPLEAEGNSGLVAGGLSGQVEEVRRLRPGGLEIEGHGLAHQGGLRWTLLVAVVDDREPLEQLIERFPESDLVLTCRDLLPLVVFDDQLAALERVEIEGVARRHVGLA